MIFAPHSMARFGAGSYTPHSARFAAHFDTLSLVPRVCAPAPKWSSSSSAECSSSGNPRRIRRIPSLGHSLRRLLTRHAGNGHLRHLNRHLEEAVEGVGGIDPISVGYLIYSSRTLRLSRENAFAPMSFKCSPSAQ